MSVHRITKDDLISLLNTSHFELLQKLNTTNFGFVDYLNKRRYNEKKSKEEEQIIELLVEILNRACSVSRDKRAALDRLLRTLKQDCQQFLFEDVPRILNLNIGQTNNIDLIRFMCNCMNILSTLLKKDFFPHEKIVNEIFPTLENYMNRLKENRIRNLEQAVSYFERLRNDVRRYEEPQINEEDDEGIITFRSLSIVPKSSDVLNCETQSIPQNIIDSPYRSVDHYLSVHYRLTREDMLRSFRECISMYIAARRQKRTLSSENQYFENVSVMYPPEYTIDGIIYNAVVTTKKDIDWSKKGLLMPGSLIFLTPNKGSQMYPNSVTCATVKSNPRANYSKSKQISIKIKLEDDQLEDTLKTDETYALIQPSAYFECYKHVLSGIKEFTDATFPLCDIITEFDFDYPEPEYIHERKYCLHEKCNEEDCSCKLFSPLNDNEWPSMNDLELDDHQYNAFKMALTKKVAVIQGPPGTGKTYIGVKIVKALLQNVEYKPVIICCLTNHALDEFLRRMLDVTKKIVRLGSQSQCAILEPHTLDNMMYAIRQHRNNEIPEKAQKKSLDLVRKIAEEVLVSNLVPYISDEFMELRSLANEISRDLKSYSMCIDQFLDEGALNDIIDREYKKQLRKVAGAFEKSISSSVLEWLVCSRSTDLYDKCRKIFLEFEKPRIKVKLPAKIENIWTLSERKRFELFYCWREECIKIKKKKLESDVKTYKILIEKPDIKPVDPVKLELLKRADIVGVTTTGASKFKRFLRFTDSRIIVIEEAAQVLESHVITSLLPNTQHLILIGDHEQLRPLPANHDLSEKYNLKVSMFERLFMNNAPSATLVCQHRMKPCIAELLVPRPYKEYTSYENVYKYEEIKGVESSVFFFDHCQSEDDNSSGTSSSNEFEAKMIANFAKYLISISYSSSQISILATYTAQVIRILHHLKELKVENIRVTSVDNFQGEENDIILLSFVRSNPHVIGFLKESNRVCVALSRAKKGMFCFGNFQLFSDKNDLWKNIVEKLREKNMIGDKLVLKCHKHNSVSPVQSAHEISNFLYSGCSEKCDFLLSCGHKCTRSCHFNDPDHVQFLCKEPCNKMIDEIRVCPRLCCQKCKKVKKQSFILPCGHSNSRKDALCSEDVPRQLPCGDEVTIPCYMDIDQYRCYGSKYIILDCGHKKAIHCYQKKEEAKIICSDLRQEMAPCGHTVEVPCHMHLQEDDLLPFCNKACDTLLNCGHSCVNLCRNCIDTCIHGFCREKCELLLACGHKCDGFCGSPCPPCGKMCFFSCGHGTFCINECLRPCVECLEPCERRCSHKKCSKKCWENCNVGACNEPCSEELPCGHQCPGLCGDPCPTKCRVCNEEYFEGDVDGLFVELECEHVIKVDCLSEHIDNCLMCYEWPSCPQCSVPIPKSIRYKNELRKAKEMCIESCDVSEEIRSIQYLVDCMYGQDFVVPAQFIPINTKILRILQMDKPKSHVLHVLKDCVMNLKKLVNVAPVLNEYIFDEHVQGKFDTLLLWIYHHLTQASYQQLNDLGAAVEQLTDEIESIRRKLK